MTESEEVEPVDPWEAARAWVVQMRISRLIGARSAAQAISDIKKSEEKGEQPPNVQKEYAPGGRYSQMDLEDSVAP